MEELNQEVQMQQQKKRICKYCNKGFPCGRSLGGHMRSHMNNNNTEPELKKKKKMMMMVSNGGGGSNTVNNSTTLMEGYVLRENPKKTWRISDSSDGYLKEEKLFCKECGKGFHSSKALFGHMKCHSEKEKEVFESLMDDEEEEDSWVDDDNQSDNEAVAVEVEVEAASPKGKRKMRRRSSRRTATRYNNKTISTNAVATTTTTTCCLSNFSNAASSVSEIGHEQEEVAMCLMMLSRDVNGFNCLAESSGNNSVLLEAKSLSSTIAANERFRAHENVKEKKKRKKKLGSLVSEPETVRFERKRSEMGSEFLRIGVKKVESAHVSVDGFFKDVEFKKSKLVQEAEFEVFDIEFERDSYDKKRVMCSTAELGKNLVKERSDLKFGNKYTSSNKKSSTRTDSYNDYELEGDSCKKARYDVSDSEICKESPKKSKYICMTCNKTFHSYQALGGHRASHKKIKGCFASKVESSENSFETDITLPDPKLMKSSSIEKEIEFEVTGTSVETSPSGSGLKKNKHECPICFKVFSSGQALGGHKRSHLVGATSDQTRSNQSIVIQKQVQPEIRDLLDLNLPATGDEEDSNGDHQLEFKPWWVGNNHKHEQLVGLFSN